MLALPEWWNLSKACETNDTALGQSDPTGAFEFQLGQESSMQSFETFKRQYFANLGLTDRRVTVAGSDLFYLATDYYWENYLLCKFLHLFHRQYPRVFVFFYRLLGENLLLFLLVLASCSCFVFIYRRQINFRYPVRFMRIQFQLVFKCKRKI